MYADRRTSTPQLQDLMSSVRGCFRIFMLKGGAGQAWHWNALGLLMIMTMAISFTGDARFPLRPACAGASRWFDGAPQRALHAGIARSDRRAEVPVAPYGGMLRLRGGGVPKFYAWLSERYPLINQDVMSDVCMPEIDNMYLDMNGIIHPCTHGNSEQLVELTQEEMFLKIFSFVDELVHVVKPQKLLFLAIDGVAPRAKMNQQRARRFKAAKDLTEKLDKANNRGGHVPTEPFDSNCITPGTKFMADLSDCLHHYIRYKIGCDSAWREPNIILSGHEVPGEGEHKIMEYIRREKMQPDYPPNLRHCIYGNDADLIMLALASHEPHFVLLRQKETFQPPRRGRGGPTTLNKAEAQEKENSKAWQLLHLSVLRDYLHLEMQGLYESMRQAGLDYDLERLVDDFVLVCYFVGNDFLPHLPALDIRTGGLDAMMRIYKRLLPQWGDYLTCAGDISLPRLGEFLGELGQIEAAMFKNRAQAALRGDQKAVAGHFQELPDQRLCGQQLEREKQWEDAEFSAHAARHGVGFGAAHEAALAVAGEEGEPGALVQQDDTEWKHTYYEKKLGLTPGDEAGMGALVQAYVEGVCWCYYYYYRGCVSWTWFYGYHYAPLASDLTPARLRTLSIGFQLGLPFEPFQQLLAVLPRASSRLLPPPLAALMLPGGSALADFYPNAFQVDMDGKNWEWEAVVLIPFIDEAVLRTETARLNYSALTPAERARNVCSRNKRYVFDTHAPPAQEPSPMATALPALHNPPVSWSHEDFRAFPPEHPTFEPRLCEGVALGPDVSAGSPSLFSRALHVPVLSKANLEIFGRKSRRESLCLRFADVLPLTSAICVDSGCLSVAGSGAGGGAEGLEAAAERLLGKACSVNWPFWRPGVISALTDGEQRAVRDGHGGINIRRLTAAEGQQHREATQSQHAMWLQKAATDISHVQTLVEARVLSSMMETARGAREGIFEPQPVLVAAQTVLCDGHVDSRFQPRPAPAVHARYVAGQSVVLLGDGGYMGALGRVVATSAEAGSGGGAGTRGEQELVTVEVLQRGARMEEEEFGKKAVSAAAHVTKWFDEGYVSTTVGLGSLMTSRLMSSFTLPLGGRARSADIDLGLNVKFERRGLYTSGYARKHRTSGKWQYSSECVALLLAYKQQFPALFSALSQLRPEMPGTLSDLLPAAALSDAPNSCNGAGASRNQGDGSRTEDMMPAAALPSAEAVAAANKAAATAVRDGEAAAAAAQAQVRATVQLGRGVGGDEDPHHQKLPQADEACVDEGVMPSVPGLLGAEGRSQAPGNNNKEYMGGQGRLAGGAGNRDAHVANVGKYMERVKTWLACQAHHALPLVSMSTLACEPQVVRVVEEHADGYLAAQDARDKQDENPSQEVGGTSVLARLQLPAARVLVPVKAGVRSALFRMSGGSRGAHGFSLGDRVVHLRDFGAVPLGWRGTVVGVEQGHPVKVEVVFDKCFPGGSTLRARCSASRGAVVEGDALLNLSRAWAAQRTGSQRPACGRGAAAAPYANANARLPALSGTARDARFQSQRQDGLLGSARGRGMLKSAKFGAASRGPGSASRHPARRGRGLAVRPGGGPGPKSGREGIGFRVQGEQRGVEGTDGAINGHSMADP